MSVTDPLLKELKSYALQLVGSDQKLIVRDDNDSLPSFCSCLERIFQRGLLPQFSAFGISKKAESWNCLEHLNDIKYNVSYAYQNAVEVAKKNERVATNEGRLRLLIRICLVKRCLHVPVQILINYRIARTFYFQHTVLGDEILAEIFLSVLLFCSRLYFNLNLDNVLFLDDTWLLPETRRLEFVPCCQLGVALVFVRGKAIAVKIRPNSVAAEENLIEVGDILYELNGCCLTTNVLGCLPSIMKKAMGQPVTACIVKALWKSKLYPPIVPLLREAGLDPVMLQANPTGNALQLNNCSTPASTITHIGSTSTGEGGEVRQIHKAINAVLSSQQESQYADVIFDCQDLGIQVLEKVSDKVLLHHSYMEISSCGCTVSTPNYFAYIAGDENYSECKNFVCYVFHCNDQTKIDTILRSIGQGFKRTHYAV